RPDRSPRVGRGDEGLAREAAGAGVPHPRGRGVRRDRPEDGPPRPGRRTSRGRGGGGLRAGHRPHRARPRPRPPPRRRPPRTLPRRQRPLIPRPSPPRAPPPPGLPPPPPPPPPPGC